MTTQSDPTRQITITGLQIDEAQAHGRQVVAAAKHITDDLQPVFQDAYAQATTDDERNKIINKWEQVQQLAEQVQTVTTTLQELVVSLNTARASATTSLDLLTEELKDAAREQSMFDPPTHALVPYERENAYHPLISRLIDATEQRVHEELEADQNALILRVSADANRNTLSDVAALICHRVDSNQFGIGKIFLRYLTLNQLQLGELQQARAVAAALIRQLDADIEAKK